MRQLRGASRVTGSTTQPRVAVQCGAYPTPRRPLCRYIGVEKIVLYDAVVQDSDRDDSEGPVLDHIVDSELLKVILSYMADGFLAVRSVSGEDSLQAQQAAHQQCIQDYGDEYSYILFLDLENYLLLPGGDSTQPGQLPELLSQDFFRYSPGTLRAPMTTESDPNAVRHQIVRE